MTKKGFLPILIIIPIAFILGIVATFFYFQLKPATPSQTAQIEQVSTSTTSPEVSTQQSSDETANWVEYANREFGFSIKHPEDMNIEESEGSVVLFRGKKLETPPNSVIDPFPVPNIGFLVRNGDQSAREACDLERCLNLQNPVVGKTMSIQDLSFNNVEAVKLLDTTRPYSATYYFANQTHTNVLLVGLLTDRGDPNNPRNESELKADFELLDKILSTFKFD